jgi:two-component system, OmpR family, sensor histidine kinase KdpD
MRTSPGNARRLVWLVAALVAPSLLTGLLVAARLPSRNYVFLYMGLVAALAITGGLWPALMAAAASFLLVDWFFVPPIHAFTIADQEDLVNLCVFFGTAGLIGYLAERQRGTRGAAKDLAEQLRRTNTDLMRLNREQAESAQAAIRLARTEQQVTTLRENERFRRELLANISHDLRTPIATILARSTDLLAGPALDQPSREGLEVIASESRRLAGLVRDMLEMSKIEAGALELDVEPLRLADAIEAAAERLRQRSPQRDVPWDADQADVEVMADWAGLGRVLDNLLANADRFGPPGTPIEIEVDANSEEGFASLRLSDHGPGVAPELQEHVFDRFVKRGGGPGVGLGLAIARGLVEAQAGRIELEAQEPGRGAVFRVTLPRTPPSRPPGEQ